MALEWARNVDYTVKPEAHHDFKAGRTAATMLSLADLAVNAPDQPLYQPYSESYVRGDNSRAGDGVARVEWIWDVISVVELATLTGIFFIDETLHSVDNMFIRSDKRLGLKPGPVERFQDFQYTVWRPEIFGPEGTPIVRSVKSVQNVRFRFTNLVEV